MWQHAFMDPMFKLTCPIYRDARDLLVDESSRRRKAGEKRSNQGEIISEAIYQFLKEARDKQIAAKMETIGGIPDEAEREAAYLNSGLFVHEVKRWLKKIEKEDRDAPKAMEEVEVPSIDELPRQARLKAPPKTMAMGAVEVDSGE